MSERRTVTAKKAALLLSVKRPRGHRTLIEFLCDVEQGKIPETTAVRKIADAFYRIVFDGADTGDALETKATKGRPRKSSREEAATTSKNARIVEFIDRRTSQDRHRGSVSRAVALAASRFAKDESTIWRIWKKRKTFLALSEAAKSIEGLNQRLSAAIAILAREQTVIDAYAATLSGKKRADFLALDGCECYRIARDSLAK